MQQKFYKLFQRFVGTVLLMIVGLGAMAQQLEMGSAGASTTATGPSTADQTITLQRNVGTSTTFTSTTPAFTVKVKLSNQAYTTLTENGIVFGTGGTNLYVPVNNIGSPLSNMFTSSPDISTAGTNYDVANNYASRLYLNANYQDVVGAALNARNYYGDITVEFSRPVIDPVVQIAGVGGGSGSGSTALGFFAEFELSTADVSAGITLTRLSGSTNFTVDASNTKVTNTSSTLGTTAQYASSQQLGSSGSIRINSSGKPITSVTFRAYLRGNGGGTSWASSGGDAFTIGSTVNLVTVSGNVFRDLNALTDGTVNGTGTNAGGTLFVNLVDSTTNLVIASVAVNSSGVYTFSDVVPSVYNLILTNGATTVGSTLTTATYPATWFSTGENLGSGAGSDATVDGKLKVSVTADLTNANFGVNSCAAGSTAPPLSGTTGANVCPSTTFNLNSLHTGTAPSGTSLVWFTNSTHTGSAYATPTAAFSGTYYAFYYDATNDCYSPATAAVTVTTGMCYKPVAQNILNAAINNSAAQSPILGLIASDASGLAIASYTIKTIPTAAQGVLYTCSTNDVPCSGTYSAVVANQVLTPAQAASLYFDPAKTFVGTASFTYDATNANGTSNTATVGVPVINNPPTVASFSTDAVAAGSSNNKLPSLIGSDGDGTVASYLVNPASSGTLTYCTTPPSTGCGTVISAATTLTPAQAATLSYNTAAGFTGNATFTYTATDDNGNASTAGTVTIPVTTLGGTPTNLPPVTQNVVSAPLNSNNSPTLISSLVGTDPDGSVTKYTVATIPSAATGVLYYCSTSSYPCTGSLIPVTAGMDLTPAQAITLQFDPAPGNNAPATFTYTATDNSSAVSNTSTFTIPIINLAPVAENTYANIPKDGTNVPVPPLVGIDGDGFITSYTVATVPNSATQGTLYYCSTGTTPCTGTQVAITAGATLTPAQAGTVNFTPVTGYTGTATATYTTTDNNGNVSVPATMTLNIVPAAGISPVATGNFTTMNANSGSTYLPNNFLKATDPDGTISNYVVSALPTATQGAYFYCTTGTVPCTGTLIALTVGTSLTPAQAASLKFTPNVNYTGPAPLSFYAVDNNGNSSNVATSFVDVVNIPPVAKGYTTANAALDGSTVSTPITATDIDGTISRYTITTIPDASTGTLRYCVTPPSTGCGTAVTAGLQLTAAQAATLNFLPAAGIAKVNEVPFTFTATDNSGALSNVATVVIPFADPKGKPVAQNIMNAAINNSAAQSPIIGLIASDASGLAIASYTIKTIPTAAQGVLYTCSTNDVPCSGSYSAVVANQVLTPAQAATLYFDPAKTFVGTASFTYDATNANGTSNTATVGIPVVNNPPSVPSFTTDAVASGSSNNKLPALVGSDGDGTVASYLVNPASSGTLTYCTTPPSTGCGTVISAATTLTPAQAATLSYNTAAGFTGNATFTYTATDDNGNVSTPGTVVVPVTNFGATPANIPPITQNVTSAALNSNNASTLISSLVGTDPDGSVTKYTIATIPSAATGVLYYCTTGNFPCTGTLTAVTAGLDLTPAQATTLQFDPAAGNNAPANFTYTATDNSAAVSNTSTFTIPIINLAPIAENTYANIPRNGTNVPVPPLVGIDGDGTIASYTVASIPNGTTEGTLYYCSTGTIPCTGTQVAITVGATLTPAQANTVNFTPISGYTGTATATYTTTDNNGNVSVPATMTLNITPSAGISPIASGSSVSMNANAGNTALATTFIKATDPDGTIASFAVTTVPTATQGSYFYCSNGTTPCTGTVTALTAGTILTPAQAATLSFTPNVNYTGPAPLSFYAVDNNGNPSNVATSVVDVVNAPPVSKGYTTANATLNGASVSTPITATDVDGTVSRYTITTIPDASTGTLRYCVTPPSTGCGTAVTAGLQLTAAQAATLNFLPAAGIAKVNEVPFTFTATDNSGALSNVATVIVPFAATAQPVAQNLLSDAMNNNAAQTHIPGLSASDPTGAAIDSYVVKTLPTAAQGVLYTCSTNSVPCTGSYNPVAVNQVLTPAQAATLYFDPAKTFSGNASFTYNAISVNGLSNIATETIPVYNNPPTVASFTTGRTAMDTANVKVPALHYADGDGTVASVTIIPPSAAQGTLTYCVTPPSTGCGTLISGTTTLTPAQSATLHFNPATGFTGNATFQYRVTDDNGLVSDNGTVTIPVTPWAWGSGANLPPVTQNVMSAPVNTSEAATLISNLVGTDPDGSLTKYTIATIPTAATGVLYYCTTGNYPCTGTLTAVTAGTDLTLAQAATLQFDPVAGNNSPAVFTYTTTDNSSAVSNTSTFTIPVVNVAPTAQNLTTSVLYNSTNFPLSALKAADPDGTVAKYTISTVPNPSTEGTVYYCSTGVLPCTGSFIALTAGTDLTPAQAATANFTPVTGYTGTTTATYTATDNNGNVSAPATITMVVSSAPLTGTPPLAKGSDVSLNTSASNTYLATNFLSATDLDGTVVSYSILSIPSATQGAYFYCSSGVAPCTPTALTAGTTLTAAQAATLSFTPTGTYVGPAPLNFYATDNSGNTSSITTSVVNLLNNPPIAKGFTAPAATIGGGAVSTPLTGTDPDGSVTSYRITSIPNDSLGTLSYCVTPPSTGCGTVISGPITLTPAQAATVAFTPAARVRVNEVPFSFTATDNTGTLSNVALVLVPLADATTLPVLLTSFNVSTQGCTALLQWTAANESYIGSFEVYQSTDNGATFNRIAQIQSSGKGVYSYTAENRKDGLYRIKVIERDGATSYSATQTAKSDCKEGTVTLYPNPVSNKVNISISGMTGAASYELYDMTGRQLQKGVLQSDYTNTVELNGIPSGAYMIRVLTGDKVNTFKLSIAQ